MLENGVARKDLSGGRLSKTRFTFTVPSGATRVTFETSGGFGDADLYVRLGGTADTGIGQWTYRSIGSTNTESILVSSGALSGTWSVLLHGYAAYTGLSLKATWSTPTGPVTQTWTNLAAAQGGQIYRTFAVPAGRTRVTFRISGGTGDADMYIKLGSPPTLTSWYARPFLIGNNESVVLSAHEGTYYIMLYGYGAFSGVTLTATYE